MKYAKTLKSTIKHKSVVYRTPRQEQSCSDRCPVLQVDMTLKLQVKIKRPEFILEASNR